MPSPPPLSTTIAHLRERLTRAPGVVLVLGSGLGGLGEEVADPVRLPYEEIPGFPVAGVRGHSGALVAGVWEGVEVVALQGRAHLYEGWPAEAVVRPLRALASLGPELVVVTNAAGGLRSEWEPGELMLIADQINFTFRNPLIGAVHPGETRFPDMSDPYDAGIRALVREVAREEGIRLREGVYAGVLGPSYETPAEVRMLAGYGADAVGMSTVAEVVAARALGMRVLGISCVTNPAAGLSDSPLSHAEVLEVADRSAGRLLRLLRAVLPRIAPANLPGEAAT